MAPSVSVVLPCRDAEATLPECVASLEAQTLDRFEVVAVDDGSMDGTRLLLEEWRDRDSRVRLIEAGGVGLVAALRAGSAAAVSGLIARMDADDVAHPGRLAEQVEFMEAHRDIAACGTGIEFFPRERLRSGFERYERWINSLRTPDEIQRDLMVECPIAHPTLAIRRSVLAGLGGYRDQGWPEDYDLILRLHLAGLRCANLPGALLRWRVSDRRLSATAPQYAASAFRRCRVHFLRSGFLPGDRPLVVWGAGKVGKALARELVRQGVPPAALLDLDRRKIGQKIHGAPVLDAADLDRIPGAYYLVAVGTPGARQEIRAALEAAGRTELTD